MLAGFGKAIVGCCKTAAGCTAATRDASPAGASGSFEPSCRSPGQTQRRKPDNQAQGLTRRGLWKGRLPRYPRGTETPRGVRRQRPGRDRGLLLRASSVGSADRILAWREDASAGNTVYKILPVRQDEFLLGTVCGLCSVPLLLPDVVGSPRGTALPCPSTPGIAASSPPGPVAQRNRGDSLWHRPWLRAAFGDLSSGRHF